MALQMNYTTPHGIDITNAYVRINNIKLQSSARAAREPFLHIEVEYYASAQARIDEKTPVGITAVIGDYDPATLVGSLSFTDSCYTWLKTQPGFESAVDV